MNNEQRTPLTHPHLAHSLNTKILFIFTFVSSCCWNFC